MKAFNLRRDCRVAVRRLQAHDVRWDLVKEAKARAKAHNAANARRATR